MAYFDLILNLIAVTLWLKWRDRSQDSGTPRISLVVTLKKTRPNQRRIWFLFTLLALLYGRTVIYWQLGRELDWTPRVWFGVVPITFRSDYFGRMLLFSVLSFLVALGFLYLCLVLLSIISDRRARTNVLHHLGLQQLGPVDAWPWWIKLLLPGTITAVFWAAMSKPLVALRLLPPPASGLHLLEQSIVVGLAVYLALKYFVVAILGLHLVSSYIYFGTSPVWGFVEEAARGILRPLAPLPLRLGKIDLAPLVGITLAWSLAWLGARGLFWLYWRLPL